MKKKNKILLLFDKKNIVNLNFFDFENFRKKIKTGFYVKLSQNISEIKYFDYILLVGFTKKIKIQKKIKYYTVHESNLPKGRGNSPIKWQLLKKVNLIVCSLIRLNDSIDEGKIILKDKLKISSTDMFDEIKKKQMEITKNLFLKLINSNFHLKEKPQRGKPSYFRKFNYLDDKININKTLNMTFNKLRLAHPNHSLYFFKNGVKFLISIKKA